MRNKPRIRFKGFTEDWEQRKLGSILIEYTEKNPGNENLPVLTSSRQGLTKQEDHFGSVQRHDISDYNVIPLGFCTYRNRSDDKTFTFNINRIVPRGLVSKFYPVFEIKNGNADFITEYLNNNIEIIKLLAVNAVGTSQVVLSLRALRNIEVTFPLKAEQVVIGNFIRKLDIYITLHQRKLEKLKLAKKALLQKLFPKNGSQFPEIRFKGFTDAWEQRKLDDIAKIKTGGGTPKTANPEYWSGNIPWIQSSDLVEGDIVHVNINKFINNNALKNSAAKLISRDSIALVTRVGVGKVAVINQEFTTSQDFLSLSDFDGSDIKFLAYQLYRLMQENAKVLQGTSIKGITKTELIEQSISIPSSGQEQNLISNVLSKIDSIITLCRCINCKCCKTIRSCEYDNNAKDLHTYYSRNGK